MPELPEVECVCRRLRKEARGAEIVRLHITRPGVAAPQRAATVERRAAGKKLAAVERRGKNIILRLSGGGALRIHLRMTGNLYVVPDVRFLPATARAWFELSDGRGILFDDPRALGRIHWHRDAELDSICKAIGPEPLSPQFTFDVLLEAARRSSKPAKIFLIDQRAVAGLGNIYAAEALHRAAIHPARPVNRLAAARLERLHEAIVAVLREAVRCLDITYSRLGRYLESDLFPLAVYGREGKPCDACGRRIRRMAQGGRSTYYCPGCQR
jgi:formamidopyrimidine-DNA glycosylase